MINTEFKVVGIEAAMFVTDKYAQQERSVRAHPVRQDSFAVTTLRMHRTEILEGMIVALENLPCE